MSSVLFPCAASSYSFAPTTSSFNRVEAASSKRLYAIGLAVLGGLSLLYGVRQYMLQRRPKGDPDLGGEETCSSKAQPNIPAHAGNTAAIPARKVETDCILDGSA